jgi:hypothetical protein
MSNTKELKNVAKAVADQLEALGYGNIKHTHMLTALSKAHGFSAWNAIAAGAGSRAPAPVVSRDAEDNQSGIWVPGQRDDEYQTYGIEVLSREFGSQMFEYLTPTARLAGFELLLRRTKTDKDSIARTYLFAVNEHLGDDITDYSDPSVVFELFSDGDYAVGLGYEDIRSVAERVFGARVGKPAMRYGMRVVRSRGPEESHLCNSTKERNDRLLALLIDEWCHGQAESLTVYFNAGIGLSSGTWAGTDEVKALRFDRDLTVGPWVEGYLEELALTVQLASRQFKVPGSF